MPLVDMSLEDLKKYEGMSPKPNDFESYWEAALEEMKAVDPKIELIEADFQVPFATCYHMYFTGVKGARLYAKVVKPKKFEGKMPAVVKFHGYTGRSDDWADLIKYAALGFMVANLDCRGQGGLSEDVGGVNGPTLFGHIIKGVYGGKDQLLYRNIFLDTAQLAGIVMAMDEVDETKVVALGGSQGGALTLACASLEPRIALALSVYPFLSDYQRVWSMDLAIQAYDGIRDYLRRFDPLHEKIDEFFDTLGYIDIQHLTPRIKGKTVMVTGLMDTICPPSTQFAAYNKIQGEKEVIIYPDFGHEHLPMLANKEVELLLGML